jgi:hypothetical protein
MTSKFAPQSAKGISVSNDDMWQGNRPNSKESRQRRSNEKRLVAADVRSGHPKDLTASKSNFRSTLEAVVDAQTGHVGFVP